jgi:hypothetical protein
MFNVLTTLKCTENPVKIGLSGTLCAENWTMAGKNHITFAQRRSVLGILFAAILSSVLSVSAATWTASDCSQSAVQAALNQASAGDTVNIPAGSATWSGSIVINKGITINGAGTNSTQLLNSQVLINGTEQSFFQIAPTTDSPITIKNIRFTQASGGVNCAINSFPGGAVLPTKVRITSCLFESFNFAIMARSMFGVVDHCEFINNRVVSRVPGFYTSSNLKQIPAPPWDWDSTYTWCYENCHMQVAASVVYQYFGDTEYPAAYTIRYCTFDVTRNPGDGYDGYDMHGSGGTAAVNPVGIQIYGNTFNYSGTTAGLKLADIRGGSGSLVYSNIINGVGAYNQVRADPAGSILPVNTYIWDNYAQGSLVGTSASEGAAAGVNFFTSKPAAYKRLVYPHPLVTGGSTNPAVSVNPGSLLFASIPVSSSATQSFTVQNAGGGTLTGTASVSAPFSIIGSASYSLGSNATGTINVRYAPTQAGVNSGTISLTGNQSITLPVTGSAWTVLPGLSFAANAGTIISPFAINPDNSISQPVQTVDPTTAGEAIYGFSIANAGNYNVSMTVITPDAGAKSIFVNIDAEPTSPDMICDFPITTTFTTLPVTWRLTGDVNPQVWSLAPGVHELIVRGREMNVSILNITISPSGAPKPAAPTNVRITSTHP